MEIVRQPKLTSVGYEGRSIDELISDLHGRSVAVPVDVHLTPLSRKPGMSKFGLSCGNEFEAC